MQYCRSFSRLFFYKKVKLLFFLNFINCQLQIHPSKCMHRVHRRCRGQFLHPVSISERVDGTRMRPNDESTNVRVSMHTINANVDRVHSFITRWCHRTSPVWLSDATGQTMLLLPFFFTLNVTGLGWSKRSLDRSRHDEPSTHACSWTVLPLRACLGQCPSPWLGQPWLHWWNPHPSSIYYRSVLWVKLRV
jgi:hypothetical protein